MWRGTLVNVLLEREKISADINKLMDEMLKKKVLMDRREGITIMYTLKLFRGNSFLGGRQVAFEVRTKAIEVLKDGMTKVYLDFESVRGVSHSFSDELLSSLTDELGDMFKKRVFIMNCDKKVQDALVGVAKLHGLMLPMFETV